MDKFYTNVSYDISKLVTNRYSTSFSLGTFCLDESIRYAIYAIYGFVRFADEIVDTFHGYDKKDLLDKFEADYREAVRTGISLNPILNAFQHTVKTYGIPDELIEAFLSSMRSDLHQSTFDEKQIDEYIYGSAEVVGLMCLKVFVNGDKLAYEQLKPYARRLGSAFQKVNFLRDIQHDTQDLKRTYFPVLADRELNDETKQIIIDDINTDYKIALEGIKKLPKSSRFGVYTAYLYYKVLTDKIDKTKTNQIMQKRIRISNITKLALLCKAFVTMKING